MASTYSTNLKIELIGTGDQSGTWGTTTNTNLGSLIEEAIAGYVTQAVTDGVATVLTIPNGTSSNGRNYVIELTGALTANRTVEVPAVDKPYIFFNNTTGGFSVTVKVSGQTGVTIANGKKAIVYTNSTDVIEVANAPVTEAGTQTLTNKTLTNPTINGFTGNTAVINVGSGQFYKDTSGNVGIGNSIPGSFVGTVKLVVGSAATTTTPGAITVYSGTATYGGLYFANGTSGNQAYRGGVEYSQSTDTLSLYSAGSIRMRIDGSGNFGFGVVPSTWTGWPSPTIEVGAQAAFAAAGNGIYFGSNYYFASGTYNYKTTAAASNYYQISGTHRWTYASSGTAGTPITFTEAMRIDSSGNVGVGTNNPASGYRISVNGSGNFFGNSNGLGRVWLGDASDSSGYVGVYRSTLGPANGTTAGNGLNFASLDGFTFSTTGGLTLAYTSQSERMRIDSGGNVGIGTSSPAASLSVAKQTTALSGTGNGYGLYLYPTSSGQCNIDAITSSSSNTSLMLRTYNNGTYNTFTMDNAGNVTASGTVSDSKGELRTVPVNSQTGAYNVASSDAGKFISITTGGVSVLTTTAFSVGQSVSIYNNSGSNQTITQGSSVTIRQVGTANTGNRTLAQYGLCTLLCVASNTYVITGGGVT